MTRGIIYVNGRRAGVFVAHVRASGAEARFLLLVLIGTLRLRSGQAQVELVPFPVSRARIASPPAKVNSRFPSTPLGAGLSPGLRRCSEWHRFVLGGSYRSAEALLFHGRPAVEGVSTASGRVTIEVKSVGQECPIHASGGNALRRLWWLRRTAGPSTAHDVHFVGVMLRSG